MPAPIHFHSVDSTGQLLVLVGKSETVRPIPLTRTETASIIAALARELARN